MAGKHGSAPKRNKKHVKRKVNPAAAFDAIRQNWRTVFQAAELSEEKLAELRAQFSAQIAPERQDTLSREYATAFTAMVLGTGDDKDWAKVVAALNTALILCERGIGFEHMDDVTEAQEEIYGAKLYYDTHGRQWLWTDKARDAINTALDVHAAQLEHPDVKEADLLSAIAEVHNRVAKQQVYKEAA
jgi:thiaminase